MYQGMKRKPSLGKGIIPFSLCVYLREMKDKEGKSFSVATPKEYQ